MATYTYKCPDCRVPIDIIRGIKDAETSMECSDCGSVMMRVYSSPSVTFNGSGFYSTDKSK
jgi:putative FmdB family regulatory protein